MRVLKYYVKNKASPASHMVLSYTSRSVHGKYEACEWAVTGIWITTCWSSSFCNNECILICNYTITSLLLIFTLWFKLLVETGQCYSCHHFVDFICVMLYFWVWHHIYIWFTRTVCLAAILIRLITQIFISLQNRKKSATIVAMGHKGGVSIQIRCHSFTMMVRFYNEIDTRWDALWMLCTNKIYEPTSVLKLQNPQWCILRPHIRLHEKKMQSFLVQIFP